jgi:hypothetical protein
VEAEFAAADGVALAHAHGRAEDAAGHGAPGVDVATAGDGIEGWAGCIVGEVFKGLLVCVRCAEDAGV